MTGGRRTELAARAVAAGDGAVQVDARELLELVGENALLHQRIAHDDRAKQLVEKFDRLMPYLSRIAAAMEAARGVIRRMHEADETLAGDELGAQLNEERDR